MSPGILDNTILHNSYSIIDKITKENQVETC